MKAKPEDFDWLGLVTFPSIFIYGVYVFNGGNAPQWANIALIVVGILGTLIDGTIVKFFFFGKKPKV